MATKEKIYDSEINPLMATIIAVCKQHKIPLIADFGLGDDLHCTTALLADEFEPSEGQLAAGRSLYNSAGFTAITITKSPTRKK